MRMKIRSLSFPGPFWDGSLARNPGGSISLTDRLIRKMVWYAVKFRNRTYVAYEKALTHILPGKPLRILVEEYPDWQRQIRRGFRSTPHELVFGPISEGSRAEFDVVMPIQIQELMRAHQWPEFLKANPIPIPSEECISLCDDKFKFGQTLIKTGFGEYIPMMTQDGELKPPYILKKRIGYWGKDCWVVRTRQEEWIAGDKRNDPAFYRQRIVPGPVEFATHILFEKGRIVKALNIKYKFGKDIPIKGQDKPLYTVIHRCPYLDLFGKILRSIDFQGICCVNYKVERGNPYILEINPRIGGSLTPFFFSFMRHLNVG